MPVQPLELLAGVLSGLKRSSQQPEQGGCDEVKNGVQIGLDVRHCIRQADLALLAGISNERSGQQLQQG
jgi:hypothetical protein